jgi:hypothetical protein
MSVPNTFAAVTTATGAQLDANFAACAQLNANNTLAGTNTFSANNTFSVGQTFSVAQTVPLSASSTCPTASPGTNTTQPASTAYALAAAAAVQAAATAAAVAAVAIQFTTQVTPIPAAGVSILQSHSLGTANFMAQLQFVCLTGEQGYSIGDVMQITRTNDGIGQVTIWQSSTQVGAPISPSAAVYLARSKDGATSFTPTAANWGYRFALKL